MIGYPASTSYAVSVDGGRHHRAPTRHYARPWRDRAIVVVLLSTGVRREEPIRRERAQVVPGTAAGQRRAHQSRLTRGRGKGNTERLVFRSADARGALTWSASSPAMPIPPVPPCF